MLNDRILDSIQNAGVIVHVAGPSLRRKSLRPRQSALNHINLEKKSNSCFHVAH